MKYVSATIALILFIIVAIFGVRLIRNQMKNFSTPSAPVTNQIGLGEFNKEGAKLRFTVVGPVEADENHRELIFEVGQGTRNLKLIKGYNQVLLKEQQLANNFNAYNAFSTALYTAGFLKEKSTVNIATYQGECPTGKVYRSELVGGDGKIKKSLWGVSCDTKTGNMSASAATMLNLFQRQFPEYRSFASDITID